MRSFINFDEIFGDSAKNRKFIGELGIKQIDEPIIKGYVIEGCFWSDQPSDPMNPFEPLNPLERRPIPQRPFRSQKTLNEVREPFVDVFDGEEFVKIYIELPGEKEGDIQLNITEGTVEVKTKNFYKMITVPGNIDVEKASSKYNNCLLTLVLPKKERSLRKERRKPEVE